MNRIAIPLAAALLLLAPAAAAQTLYTFGAALSGANEVPPNASTGVGVIAVVYVDNPSPTPDGIVVRGVFTGLEGDYAASHLHEAPAGSNGPIVQGLTATVGPDDRSGEWEEASNTYAAPAGFLADLQAGLIYANVHSDAFPGGELRGQLAPVPLVDGDLSDPQYQTLATKQNANMGFGPDIDVTEIVYHADVENQVFFLGLKGKLDTASGDGLGLWLDFGELDGAPAGSALGGVPLAGHFMGAAGNPNYTADFEVDYAFAINPGGGASEVFFDAVKYVGAVQSDYLGSTDQSGTVAFGPPDAVDNSGNPAFFRAVAFAFDNSGGADTGLEFAIPFSELGITGEPPSDLSAFAFVVSNSAYFSDVTVPGNVTAGNLGFDPDFDANLTSADCSCPNPSSPIGTRPYHATVSISGGTCEQSLSATLDDPNPAPGDVITFTVTVTNNAAAPAPLDLWLDATGPASRTVRLGSGTLPAGATVTRSVRLRIPANAPAGSYALDLNIGAFPDDVCDTVEFTLNVSAPAVPGGGTEFEVVEAFSTARASAGAGATVAVSPNPFARQTTIAYEVGEAADVRLSVYDVLGREVAVLVDARVEAGAHSAVFEARGLAAGTYVYRLVVGNDVQTGQLSVIR